MSDVYFNRMKGELEELISATVKAKLVRSTSSWTPDADDDYLADANSAGLVEIDASGYSEQTLGTKSIEIDDTNDRREFHCANLAFGTIASGQTISGLLIYIDTGNAATSKLVAFFDSITGLPFATNGQAFNINIPAEGLLRCKAAA